MVLRRRVLVLVVIGFMARFSLYIGTNPDLALHRSRAAVGATIINPMVNNSLGSPIVFRRIFVVLAVRGQCPNLRLYLPVQQGNSHGHGDSFVPATKDNTIFPIQFVFRRGVPFACVFVVMGSRVPRASAEVGVGVLRKRQFLGSVPGDLLDMLSGRVDVRQRFTFYRSLNSARLGLRIQVNNDQFVSRDYPSRRMVILRRNRVQRLIRGTTSAINIVDVHRSPFPSDFSFFFLYQRNASRRERGRGRRSPFRGARRIC